MITVNLTPEELRAVTAYLIDKLQREHRGYATIDTLKSVLARIEELEAMLR